MLELRRTTVTAADGPWCETELGRAWSDPALHPPPAPGDEVVVNVQARELGLGSGGYDVVVANLTRGLEHTPLGEAHVMKLNYTPLQHAVQPADGSIAAARAAGTPVAVFPLHGHLPALAWGLQQAAPGTRLGYVQTAGGALPGRLSNAVAELRERGWLDHHVTAGPAYGGEHEAITTAGAICSAIEAGCDAVVCGPGPGILGSGTELGHGGMVALDSAHAALALGLPTLLVARLSGADPRERHRGISHHTRTVLELLLAPVTVALPRGEQPADDRHDWRTADGSLDGFPWPLRTMGREDPRFFAAAAAAGRTLAAMITRL
ncbi:MAG TPA: DUF3866 family protein [Capillimicrobium sp.]|nr:DUF3866 family protein [Capillimicrobium sp.]